ncbi:MAG: IS110 family transposase [Candidatus Paceibacterota bacterium]
MFTVLLIRFKSLDKLCSFVGLVPSTNSSGEKEIASKITPRSNKPIRTVIIEAAWVASRMDPVLSLKYNELCKRMKPSEAIIRIAKKILSRIRYVMINKTQYVYSVIN